MKILHLNNEKTWRGGERQTLLLAAALHERGVVSVIGCRPGAALEQQAQTESVATLPIPGENLGAAFALSRTARDFDLIHCHTGRGHSLAALTACAHRRPFLVTRRVDFMPGDGLFNRYKFRRAARVVCISHFIADQLVGWGVPKERLAIIPSTVPRPDPKLLTAEHCESVRNRLGVASGVKLIGNIAALVGHKDHATLLRAAKMVVERRKDVRFVILGEGELRKPLEKLRRELGLEQLVLMPGFVPEAEQCLPAFDVFAMSSCMEGLGSIVLDAFAANVPVVATAGGGLPETVRNGETGLLVPVGDHAGLAEALLRLLEDKKLATRMLAAAQAWVLAERSVERMTSDYMKLYDQVLSRPGVAAGDSRNPGVNLR